MMRSFKAIDVYHAKRDDSLIEVLFLIKFFINNHVNSFFSIGSILYASIWALSKIIVLRATINFRNRGEANRRYVQNQILTFDCNEIGGALSPHLQDCYLHPLLKNL